MDHFQLKRVKQWQRSLISGYFRECQAVLSKMHDNNPYYNIPELSLLVTLSYYAMKEYFEQIPLDKEAKIQLTNSDCTVKMQAGKWGNACIGSQIIDPSINKMNYKWMIKFDKMIANAEIGFISDFDTECTISYTDSPQYVMDCKYGSITICDEYANQNPFREHDVRQGDTICLEFNVDGEGSYISFSNNRTHKRFVIKSDEIKMEFKYRMAVSLYQPSDSLSIVDFEYTSL